MKVFKANSLPDEVTHKGLVYKADVGISALYMSGSKPPIEESDYVQVHVLSSRLRGKLDLHHKPYTPSVFYFKKQPKTEKNENN